MPAPRKASSANHPKIGMVDNKHYDGRVQLGDRLGNYSREATTRGRGTSLHSVFPHYCYQSKCTTALGTPVGSVSQSRCGTTGTNPTPSGKPIAVSRDCASDGACHAGQIYASPLLISPETRESAAAVETATATCPPGRTPMHDDGRWTGSVA
jgi:hypothetical protein